MVRDPHHVANCSRNHSCRRPDPRLDSFTQSQHSAKRTAFCSFTEVKCPYCVGDSEHYDLKINFPKPLSSKLFICT